MEGFSDQTTKRDCRVRYSFINRACTRRSVSKDRRYHCIHREDHLQHEKTREQHVRMLSEEHKPCWKCEKANSTGVIFSTCGAMSGPRFAKKRGSRQSQTSGHFKALCLWTSLVVKKKATCRRRHGQSNKEYELSLLPMLFGGQRERVSPTQATQQERRRSSFFRNISVRVAFAETRVEGNRALKWDEIAQEKGSKWFCPPTVDENTVHFDARADIPHTKHRIHEDFSLAVTLAKQVQDRGAPPSSQPQDRT